MAVSPQVTARLDESTYKALVKLAELEHKTIADVTRELIQIGLGKKEAPESEHLEKVRKVAEATEKMERKFAELEDEMTRSRRMTAAGLYWTELLWRGGLPKDDSPVEVERGRYLTRKILLVATENLFFK